ncbi:MAG: Cd(II)/Pb(II)-responsive transcriptional regulator [Curvibacter sp.]|nr:MAG: Cd(II)/Pb(II)-responsive transcriptional regulator [Curvibacter sp.]
MKIGELAKKTGTQVETVRYYEREGLLPTPLRTDGNYRLYGDNHVERLSFIRHCRSLDMTLGEIRTLLGFKDAPEDNCEQVNILLDEHIGHVAQRIQELRALEQQLKDLRAQCQETQQSARCGILSELSSVSRAQPAHVSPAHVHGTHARAGQTAVKRR